MSAEPQCPQCSSPYTYADRGMQICSECAHEWMLASPGQAETSSGAGRVYRDANGTELQDGDTVTVIKDLKVGGSSSVVKMGTKVKNIRLVDADHDIDCNIKGIGAMKLKSCFVRKVVS